MPYRMWRHRCRCTRGVYWTTQPACASCGVAGRPDGWHLTMYEKMACYQYVYGLKPMGPHRALADKLLTGLRSSCGRCKGRGILSRGHASWRLCPGCEGTGGAWTVPDEVVQRARAAVLAQYPEAEARSAPARLTSPFLAFHVESGMVVDLKDLVDG